MCPASAPVVSAAPGFREVFEANAGYVWRCLRRLGVQSADVDDVCQEVFVVAHRKLPDFDHRVPVRTWLYAIAVRKASDYRKAARHKREAMPGDLPDAPIEASQSQAFEEKVALAWLDQVLATLDDGPRNAFVLYEIEALPMKDVAAAMECPLQTAYSRLHNARRVIEQAIAHRRATEGGAT